MDPTVGATKSGEMLLNSSYRQQDCDFIASEERNWQRASRTVQCGLLGGSMASLRLPSHSRTSTTTTSLQAYLPAPEDKPAWVHRESIPPWIAALSVLASKPKNHKLAMIRPLP